MDLVAYGITLALVCAAPGPAVATLMVRALAGEVRAAAVFTVGMTLGFLLVLLAVVAGLGIWLGGLQSFHTAARAAGVAYLVWIAWHLWSKGSQVSAPAHHLKARDDLLEIGAGMSLAMSSPFTVVFFLSMMGTLGGTPAGSQADLPALALVTVLVSGGVHAAYIFLAAPFRRLLAKPRYQLQARRALAGLLGCAALWLAVG